MGVMGCGRNGCNKIMCDHLILGSYYLCDDCLEEFKSCMRTWPSTLLQSPNTTPELLVQHFMGTQPRTYTALQAILKAFDEETKWMISTR